MSPTLTKASLHLMKYIMLPTLYPIHVIAQAQAVMEWVIIQENTETWFKL